MPSQSLLLIFLAVLCACSDDAQPVPDRGTDESPSTDDDDAVVDSGASKPKDAGKPSSDETDATLQPDIDARAAPVDAGDADVAGDASVISSACDRACLIGHLDTYLAALTAHSPDTARFASSLRYTDNGKEAKTGDGLWKTASSVRADTRLSYADPVTGQAGTMVVLLENTTPVIYMARIKVVERQITELETMTVRRQGAANGFFSPDGMIPKPVFLQEVPANKRMTREALQAEVDLYVDFLEGASGSKVHFDSQCVRFENGQQTASAGSIGSQRWSFDVTRRYLVIDEEAGIVWGMFPFSQAASALVVGEAFKVVDNKIMMIQAVMANMPAKAWD